MADGSQGARLDILAKDPLTNVVYGIEVKTGDRPGFTEGQIAVYPHIMWGGSVVELDGKAIALGLPPKTPLMPIPIFLMIQKDGDSAPDYREIDPEKIWRYYRGN